MATNIDALTPDQLPKFTKELLMAFRELIVSETYKDVSVDGYLRPTLEKWLQILKAKYDNDFTELEAQLWNLFLASQDQREATYQEQLVAQGYQELGNYAAGILIENLNQVVTVGDYAYRLSPTVERPYVTDGDWDGQRNDFIQINFVTASQLLSEKDARITADAQLQSQITEAAPIAIAERPVVQYHSNTITNSMTIPANQNAFSAGPEITIAPGQEVTLMPGASWIVMNGSVL